MCRLWRQLWDWNGLHSSIRTKDGDKMWWIPALKFWILISRSINVRLQTFHTHGVQRAFLNVINKVVLEYKATVFIFLRGLIKKTKLCPMNKHYFNNLQCHAILVLIILITCNNCSFFPPGATQPIVGVYFTVLYRALASLRTRLLDHTQRRATVGRTPLNEWSVRRRDLYLTTHNTHNRQISMPRMGFEPTIATGERP